MSEAFGIVAGAAGLVQFLEVIRKSYDAISRARTFDSDYLSYLLRLSICHLRFNRWHTTSNPETGTLGVENILEHLNKLFARALKIASSSVPVSPNIASPPASVLSSLTHEIRELVIALQQRSEASRRKKARKVISWVFHRYNSLKEVIIDIEKFLDSLEKLSPPEEDQYRRRMADEVEKIAKGQRELAFLMMAARLTDRSLSNAAAERMDPTPFNSSAASQQGNRASQQGNGASQQGRGAPQPGSRANEQTFQTINVDESEGAVVTGNEISKDSPPTSQRFGNINGRKSKNLRVVGNYSGPPLP